MGIRLIMVTVLCSVTSAVMAQTPFNYTIKGELKDSANNGKTLYLMSYDTHKNIDSTIVVQDKFTFAGKATHNEFCRIDVPPRVYFNLILEKGETSLSKKVNGRNIMGPMNKEMEGILTTLNSLYKRGQGKRKELEAKYTDKEELQKATTELYAEMNKQAADKGEELFKLHKNDAIGQFMMFTPFLPEDIVAQEKILNSFGPWLKSTETAKGKVATLQKLKATAEGKIYTDIKGKDINGQPIALSNFVGKGNYVLMDMWASWCGPCKGEIPNIKLLNDKYKDKGLTVVGIFVWDKEANLKKAVEEEKVDWAQIFDSQENATKLYGVEGIPTIILFAPDGKILKRGLRGEEMIMAVDKVMNKK